MDKLLIGGYEPKIIVGTGAAVTLPANCIALIPKTGTIAVSVLRRSDDASVNHADATHMNLVNTTNINDGGIPLVAGLTENGTQQYWTSITFTLSSELWAIKI
jgi:hypothetical protein